jgi:hypothetical protein
VSDSTFDPARRAQGLEMFTEVSGFPAPQVQGPFMEVMVDQVFVTHFAAYAGYPKASLLHTTVERVWSQRQQSA